MAQCSLLQPLRSPSAALTQVCNEPHFLKLHMLQVFICSVAERTRALQLQECKSGQRPISVLQARSQETAQTPCCTKTESLTPRWLQSRRHQVVDTMNAEGYKGRLHQDKLPSSATKLSLAPP